MTVGWSQNVQYILLGIRIGLSAPVSDRPYFAVRPNELRNGWYLSEGIGPARLSHVYETS